MPVSSKHILQQGPILASMGKVALATLRPKPPKNGASNPITTPGPELVADLPPRPKGLIRDYVRHVGGDPSAYKTTVPAHLFPQWAFGLASQGLTDLPYPLARVVNGGCRIESKAPLPIGEKLNVRVRLENIDDNGRRAVIQTRIITSTKSAPDALTADMYAIIPLSRGDKKKKGPKKEKPRVPDTATEIAYWKLRADAGLDFAKLTGDFNPIHWVPAYAKMSGFKNTILHGFSTMARAIEGLHRARVGTETVKMFDCKFTRPLVLPARVGLYLDGEDGIYVGDAPGGPAYLVGTYATKSIR